LTLGLPGLSAETMGKSADILHSGRLGTFSNSAAKYTSSIDIDTRLLQAVIAINSAHVAMLTKQKILDRIVSKQLIRALERVPKKLKLSETLEDIHMNVENYVISQVGNDIGGMLNLGKSRNDQVATALRMTLRNELLSIARNLISFQSTILNLALKEHSTIMPGYTHLQHAQPVTVGHHFLAYFDSVERDLDRLFECYTRVNKCPMGAGALASTGLQIDRTLTASLLGFQGLIENSLDAVASRDFAIEAIYVYAEIMTDLSRLSEELILWATKEFSFIEISDKYASTSSMMPQKKNPVVPEIARAKAAQVLGDLFSSLGIVKALPLSYNLDLQELTRNLWSATDKTKETVELLSEVLQNISFNKEILANATSRDETLFATELADYLVSKYGLSFREAHNRVASLVRYSSNHSNVRNPLSGLNQSDLSAILKVPITQIEIRELIDPITVLKKRHSVGSPNPVLVKKACQRRSNMVVNRRKNLRKLEASLLRARHNLDLMMMKMVRARSEIKTRRNETIATKQMEQARLTEVKQ
jgi:argininosuccinate lyase